MLEVVDHYRRAGVLAGITREVVLELAAADGAPVDVGRPSGDLLASADAAFATMSSLGVVPIVELDGRPLPLSPDVAAPLQERYWSVVADDARPAPGHAR